MDLTRAEPASHRVFISYSSRDSDAARSIVDALEARDIPCWIAPRNVTPGSLYDAEIIDGIESCRLFVLLLSHHSNESPHVRKEVERADSKNRHILTIRLEDVSLSKSLEYHLSALQWIDAFPLPLDSYLSRLAEAVKQAIRAKSPAYRSPSLRRVEDVSHPESLSPLADPSSGPERPNNLPHHATRFIGREREIGEVKALLTKTRLLTLAGAGGSGKTRLSLQVGTDLEDHYADGVWLVELAALTDPSLVPKAVADALDVGEVAGRSLERRLEQWLQFKHLLLVIDNCEHLVSACADLANSLIRRCPSLSILASSREPLGVSGEQVYLVPGLTLPDPQQVQTPDRILQSEAVRLFCERAQAVKPSFMLTDQNAAAVAQICARLDGMPLAIVLAACRVNVLTPEQIAPRLDNQFQLLTGGSRSALPRHQTLRAVLDWSYDLLTEPERLLLCRLSVFRDDCALEAAETVCGYDGIEDWEVLDFLSRLVNKSLVEADNFDGAARYRLLETIRQYGREKLAASQMLDSLLTRHAAYYLALALDQEPPLSRGERGLTRTQLDGYELEQGNYRGALEWFLTDAASGPPDIERLENGIRLATALTPFWAIRYYFKDGFFWLTKGLERSDPGMDGNPTVDPLVRARAFYWTGCLYSPNHSLESVRPYFHQALTIFRSLCDAEGIAASLSNLCRGITEQNLLDEALTLYRQCHNDAGKASLYERMADLASEQDDFRTAENLAAQALSIERTLGASAGLAYSFYCLGRVYRRAGRFQAAFRHIQEALLIFEEIRHEARFIVTFELMELSFKDSDYSAAQRIGAQLVDTLIAANRNGDASSTAFSLGTVALAQGDLPQAHSWFQRSFDLCGRDDPFGKARGHLHLARVAVFQQRYFEAERDLDAALSIFQGIKRWQGIVRCHLVRGNMNMAQGNLIEAYHCYRQGLHAVVFENTCPLGEADACPPGDVLSYGGEAVLCIVEAIATVTSDVKSAVVLVGAAHHWEVDLSNTYTDIEAVERHRSCPGLLREKMTEAEFAVAWTEGKTMTVAQTLDLALRLPPPTSISTA